MCQGHDEDSPSQDQTWSWDEESQSHVQRSVLAQVEDEVQRRLSRERGRGQAHTRERQVGGRDNQEAGTVTFRPWPRSLVRFPKGAGSAPGTGHPMPLPSNLLAPCSQCTARPPEASCFSEPVRFGPQPRSWSGCSEWRRRSPCFSYRSCSSRLGCWGPRSRDASGEWDLSYAVLSGCLLKGPWPNLCSKALVPLHVHF